RKGYIHKDDVETISDIQHTLNGVALKSQTKGYVSASTNSKALKSYSVGSILKYKTFTSSWYEATVFINGVAQTGYIHKSDVEDVQESQKTLYGVALKKPTSIYGKASSNSKTLKTYEMGSILKYKTFSTNWYEALVYINGKPHTGYIHKNDVEEVETSQKTLYGVALKNPTSIYEKASTSSKTLKTYGIGSILK